MFKPTILIVLLVIVALGIGGFVFVSKKGGPPEIRDMKEESVVDGNLPSAEDLSEPAAAEDDKTVQVQTPTAVPLSSPAPAPVVKSTSPKPSPAPAPAPAPAPVSKPASTPPPSSASYSEASSKLKALNQTSSEFDNYSNSANQMNENTSL